MVREGLTKKVTFEQRPRCEEISHMDTCGKNFLGRERCKGPEIDVCLACVKKKKKAHAAGTEQAGRQ